jgi:hypothetical protein
MSRAVSSTLSAKRAIAAKRGRRPVQERSARGRYFVERTTDASQFALFVPVVATRALRNRNPSSPLTMSSMSIDPMASLQNDPMKTASPIATTAMAAQDSPKTLHDPCVHIATGKFVGMPNPLMKSRWHDGHRVQRRCEAYADQRKSAGN